MAAECLGSIRLCRVRATRLDSVGNPEAGPNNVYVTDKSIQLLVTPQTDQGTERTLRSGCSCIIGQYKPPELLKYFTLELDLGVLEPGLLEMLTGASAILSSTLPIGVWWQSSQLFDCAADAQPNICLEGWMDAWDVDHQAASPHRFVHWIWPSTYWQIGAHTLAEDFAQPKLTGFTRGNTVWGAGIYGDQPEAAKPFGGFFYTDSIPAAACGYQSHGIT